MSSIDLMSNMAMDSYPEVNGYVHPFSMDMLDDLSWPTHFMSPHMSPQYMAAAPPYPTSPDCVTTTISNRAQNITIQHQQHHTQSPSARSSISSNTTARPHLSPKQGSATPPYHQPPKQDRERRKAQNRASQRAYRERKEIQLRDLAASLKETEQAMAEAEQENKELAARLDRMRNDLEALRRENGLLRKLEAAHDATSPMQGLEEGTEQKIQQQHVGGTMETPRVVPTPPLMEAESDSESRSITESIVDTPKDVELLMEGFDWGGILLGSKEASAAAVELSDTQVFW